MVAENFAFFEMSDLELLSISGALIICGLLVGKSQSGGLNLLLLRYAFDVTDLLLKGHCQLLDKINCANHRETAVDNKVEMFAVFTLLDNARVSEHRLALAHHDELEEAAESLLCLFQPPGRLVVVQNLFMLLHQEVFDV
mmetsp:Transcript_37569/g.49438  ORF Transcript_37569/g.49438 Transcript_37569/m.49438 type:complete len:140 (+) Transcript_37569:324-743(+)